MKKNLQPLTPAALYARVSSDRQDVDLSVSARVRARGILNCWTALCCSTLPPRLRTDVGRGGEAGPAPDTCGPPSSQPVPPPGFFRRLPGRARNGVTGSGGGCVQDVGGRCGGRSVGQADARSPRGRYAALGTPSPFSRRRSRVMAADQSKSSRRQVSSKPAP